MKNKAFTLIEMISAVAIMAIMATILIINVSKKVNESREKAYSTLIQSIELAAQNYISSTTDTLDDYNLNDWDNVTLQTLIENNYFSNSLINPLTKDPIPSTDVVYITRDYNSKIKSQYNINQNIDPKITLIGKYNYYVLVGSSFHDPGIIATDSNGNDITSSVTTTNNINTSQIGNYIKTYTYGNTSITRNILVVDNTRYQIESSWKLLTIDPNGGTYNGKAGSTIYSLKENSPLDLEVPIKEGHVFSQWRNSSNSTSISLENSIYTLTMGNEDTTIEAVWSSEVILTVELAGGSTTQTFNASYTPGTTITLTNPTQIGNVFTGWEVNVESGSSITNDELLIGSSNVTLTATWLSFSDMFTYTLTNGNAGVSGTNYKVINDSNIDCPYCFRIKFLTSGTFVPKITLPIDVFLVGGGGAGGRSADNGTKSGGGGGGGGTVKTQQTTMNKNAEYTITIGTSGKHSTANSGYGGTGGTTSAFDFTATGGSGGYGYLGDANNHAGGTGGNNGGIGRSGTGTAGGEYGISTTTCEFGGGTTTKCNTGVSAYAGGGGGGGGNGGSGGTGGAGGGGTGAGVGGCTGDTGAANTGGGGGGAYSKGTCYGGDGGTGVVIIRNQR